MCITNYPYAVVGLVAYTPLCGVGDGVGGMLLSSRAERLTSSPAVPPACW